METKNSSSLNQPLHRRLHSLDETLYFSKDENEVPKEKEIVENIKDNWKSGLTVGLVNLPLCIALAVASGATPSAGILSGIIGGMVHGFFGGSHFNIVGPTGALSGFLATCVYRYGVSSLPYIAIISGVLTLVCRKYGLQKYIDLFPLAVNEGFTVGVAMIIILNQMNSALGIGKINTTNYIIVNSTLVEEIITEVSNESEESLIGKVIENLKHINQMNPQAFLVFIIFFAGLFYLIRNYPLIPWQAVAAVVGIFIGSSGKVNIETLFSKFGEIKMNIADFSYMKLPPTFLLSPTVWVDALPIAFIAVLETLISAKIADNLTRTQFNKSNELRGLGYSNILCGLLGGIPITAALARTTLNIKSGATHRVSSIINGVVLFIASFVFIKYFKFLPLCVAAAQVSIVAVRMVNYEEVRILYEKDRINFYILIATGTICILTDPTVGIVFGMLIYLIHFSENLTIPWTEIITTSETKTSDDINIDNNKESSHLSFKVKEHGKIVNQNFLVENLNTFISDLPRGEGEYILYRIIGIVNFMNVKEHTDKLKKFAKSENVTVVVSFRYLHFIDIEAMHAIKHLLDEIAKEREENKLNLHNKIVVTGLDKKNIKIFQDREWIADLHKKDMLIFRDKQNNYFED